jgi:hypothetical protein
MDLFRNTFGLGGGRINFYKYSPQRECFVGFDQAYVKTDLSSGELFQMLRDAANTRNYALNDTFLGYFLQFKVVKEMQQRKKYTPPNIRNRPHYRVSIDTTKNLATGLSQHELLYNLSRNHGAMVYYACPMLFDRSVLYEIDVDLDDLRLADLALCPSPYADNDNHFIYYNDRQAMPVWCSEPVEGKAVTPRDFAAAVGGATQAARTGRISKEPPRASDPCRSGRAEPRLRNIRGYDIAKSSSARSRFANDHKGRRARQRERNNMMPELRPQRHCTRPLNR